MTTRAHYHGVFVCACGAVRSQCRCLEDHKPQYVVSQTCALCRGQAPLGMRTFVWDDALAQSTTQDKQLALVRALRAAIEQL